MTVTVSDERDETNTPDTVIDDTIAVTINLINVDEPGTVTISGVEVGGETLTASVTDLDGTITGLSWQWRRQQGSGSNFNNISGATSNTYAPVAADVGKKLKVVATYTDPQGSGKSAEAETGMIGAGNEDPTFNDGTTTTRSVNENSAANTSVGAAVEATDGDMDTLYYSMTSMASVPFSVTAGGQILTTVPMTNYESQSSYTVTLNVSDRKDNAGNADTVTDDSITVTINITDVNEAPTITTTQTTKSVAENQTAVLTYAATDVDNNSESHDSSNTLAWSVESADDGGFFEIDSSSGVLTFKAAPDFEDKQDAGANNVYNVTVKVTDNGIDGNRGSGNHLSVSKSLAVTVTDVNETPTITSGPTTISKDENTATSEVIATYVATDPDATTGTMTWDLQGNDAGDFNIRSTVNGTAELTFKNSPDFEDAADTGTDNVYDVTVRVRDNGSPRLQDTRAVDVTVEDVNETPVISGDASPSFAEIEYDDTSPVLTIGTYTASDDEGDTMSWDVSGTDAAHFSIDTSTGVLSFSISPDFENPADLEDSNMMGGSDNIYEIVIEATDDNAQSGKTGLKTGTYAVTVTVTGVDETPEITTDGTSHTVPSFMEIEWDADSADLSVADYDGRDEEGQTLSWSKLGTDAGDFTIDSSTGELSFAQRPNYEEPVDGNTDNVYNITIRATDTASNSRDLVVVVTVTDVNERPDIDEDFSGLQEYVEIEYDADTAMAGVLREVHTFTAEDYDDGDTFTWSLTGTDADDLEIDSNSGVLTFQQDDNLDVGPLPNYEHPQDMDNGNTYSVTVVATDNHMKAEEYAVVITVTNVNEKPQFTGTPQATITLDESDANTTYDGAAITTYASHDEEGRVTWSLTGTDSGDFDINSAGAVTFKETPNFEEPEDSDRNNVYNFTVVMRDVLSGPSRRTAELNVTVTVEDIEEDGTASITAGASPGVGDGVTFSLTDPDGEIMATTTGPSWEVQRGSGGSWTEATTQITGIPPSGEPIYTYTAQEADTGEQLRVVVTYTDRRGVGKRATSEPTNAVTADPRVNVPPRLVENAFFVSEGPAIIEVATLTATDRDGDTVTFAMLEEHDHELFELSSSGRLRAVEALDFETNQSPSITVTLSDGKNDDGNADNSVDVRTNIRIIVGDEEEPGVITFSPPEPEAGTPVTATLTDGDGGVSEPMWQWARSENGRSDWSNIPGATSSTYTPTVNDEDFYLRATVTYEDQRGPDKQEGITGPVPSENRRPLFPSTETGERTVPENTRAGVNIGAPVAAEDPENDRLTYTLSGLDAAAFTIVTSSGQIRVASGTTLDFETKDSYQVTVEVHDGKDGTGATSATIDDTQNVTITVENVEEPGTVTLSSETATIQARVPVTATLEDDDGPTSVTWQWERSRSRTSGWFNIMGETFATFTPADTDIGGYIRATASYNDGENSGKTAQAVPSRVGQAPPVNSAPAFPATEDGRRELAENSGGGTAVGDRVEATDFNDDPLTYSLSGTDAALFTVGTGDGQLRVATDADLDFETKRTLRVTVEVTDGKNSLGDTDKDAIDDRQNVTITLTDVNEAPIVSGDASVSIEENSDRALATYSGADPERDTLTWSVSGNTFWISQRGELYFRSPPDYETQTSYTANISVEDEEGLSDFLSVGVTVTDEEEDGVVTISPPRGWADVATRFSASLDDDDGSVTGEAWQWERSSNRSSWQEIPDATQRGYTATADDVDKYLRATVRYTDLRGGNKKAVAARSVKVDATRPTEPNNPPVFTEAPPGTRSIGQGTSVDPRIDAPVTRSIGQGTSADRRIGAPVRATDEDPGDVLTYSLSGADDAGLFSIDWDTGQIRTKDVLDYDPDGTNEYTVRVNVHDGFDAGYSPSPSIDATITVTITVTQVVRRTPSGGGGGGGGLPVGGGGGGGGGFAPAPIAPRFVDGSRATREMPMNAQVGDAVGGPVAATHPDDDVTYTLSGAFADLFTVDDDIGQIRLGRAVTPELGRTYTVELTATASSGGRGVIIVDIEVVEPTPHRYDLDANRIFEKSEVVNAIADYFAGLIEKEDVVEVISAYFAQ